MRVCLFLVYNLRDKMSHFVRGMPNDLVEECRVALLHDNMDISRLMVLSQQVKHSRLKQKNRV